MEKILVFAPHPDDDIIGCGGSIAWHIQQNHQVAIVYLTSGEAGSLDYPPRELARLREEEATRAAARLGVGDLTFLHYPDGYIEITRESLSAITQLIRGRQPSVIYLPHPADATRDHRQTSQIVLEACKRAAGPWFQECIDPPWTVDTLLGYEVWTPLAQVSWSQDITPFMEVKLAALRMHQSQLAHIKYDEAIEGLNRYRGAMCGKGNYCECFQILRAKLA